MWVVALNPNGSDYRGGQWELIVCSPELITQT